MKFFKTTKGAFNYIKRNAETGKEKSLNDSLYFGMGLYCWADMAKWFNVADTSSCDAAMYHFKNDSEIMKFIIVINSQQQPTLCPTPISEIYR